MGKPKAPKAPDPMETAAASTGTNIGTAIANTTMGNVNQVGPDGSLTYETTGTQSWTDPYTGQTYDLPQYTATQALSPEQQAIHDANQAAQLNLGNTAANQSAFLQDYLASNPSYDTSDVEQHLFELSDQRVAPVIERERAALETRLANQGLTPGSAAWEAEMSQHNQRANDQYNSMALQGRGQAMSELFAQRNQPINEITALLSGSQVSQPNFAINTPSQAATTDVAGLINQNYQQKYQNYQQQMAQTQSVLGGLFGLASGGLAGGYF